MQKKIFLILLALLVPLATAIGIAYLALPEAIPAVTARRIPATLAQAKQMTEERLHHLRTLTQEQWNTERKTIPHKHPPEKIADAIARAQWRLDDLNRMSETQWAIEKKHLEARSKAD